MGDPSLFIQAVTQAWYYNNDCDYSLTLITCDSGILTSHEPFHFTMNLIIVFYSSFLILIFFKMFLKKKTKQIKKYKKTQIYSKTLFKTQKQTSFQCFFVLSLFNLGIVRQCGSIVFLRFLKFLVLN